MRIWCLGIFLIACSANPVAGAPADEARATSPAEVMASGDSVKPPFKVAGEAEGLLLVYYDESGAPHTAQKRSDVPEAQRAFVRVDSLEVAPEQRLDPAFMYVADLRKPGSDGSYAVRKVQREAFEASFQKAAAAEQVAANGKSDDVIIYGASWCGACKQAARYLTQKGVAFVERDIEREPGARTEMLEKARAQGVSASGIPVIDVYGKLLGGFDPVAVDRLLAQK
jgi:glutaredoxin